MAVGGLAQLTPIKGLQGRLWQAVATATGDASGGNATLTIEIPRVKDDVWLPIQVLFEGDALITAWFYGAQQFQSESGVWYTHAVAATTTAGGYLSPVDHVSVVKALGPAIWLGKLLAANQPAWQMIQGNNNTTPFRFGITAVRLPRNDDLSNALSRMWIRP